MFIAAPKCRFVISQHRETGENI